MRLYHRCRTGVWLALAGLLAAPSPALAQCAACSCSVSATNLNFGTYNPTTVTPTTANANIGISCFSILVLMVGTIDVSLSAGSSGSVTSRTLKRGTSTLNYNVYQDASYSTLLGLGGSNGSLLPISISGLLTYNTNRTAYGRIPARQWVAAGTYTDSLVVTLAF